MRNPQLNSRGELTHLLTTEGLSRAILTRLLDAIETCLSQADERIENLPALKDKKIVDLVVDNVRSTTARSLAQGADILVVRSSVSGMPHFLAQQVPAPTHVISAGDGCHADPMVALADVFTIRQSKKDFSNLTVLLIGDILHSAVARSDIHALTTLGVAEVRVAGPLTLLPEGLAQLGVRACTDLDEGLANADVIIVLGPEPAPARSDSSYVPSVQEYLTCYGLTAERLACAKKDCLVIAADTPRKPLEIAVRHAVMTTIAGAVS